MSLQIANSIQLKERVSAFKKHIQNLQKSRCRFNKNQQNSPSRLLLSNLMNKYQKSQFKQIHNQNRVLLSKLIKIQSGKKIFNETETNKNFKENYLKTKYGQRRRILSEIGKQNKNLSQKLTRCSSNYKSSCFQWRSDIDKQKYLKNLTSKKYGIMNHDFRALAQKQLQQEKKLSLKLNRQIKFIPQQSNKKKLKI